jgi:predicted metal-binding membrane protein
VIAVLAVTNPGEAPIPRVLELNPSAGKVRIIQLITGLYLLIWIGAGLWAFIVAFLKHPGVLQPLTDLSQAWLGVVVAAAYSYFGIKGTATPART